MDAKSNASSADAVEWRMAFAPTVPESDSALNVMTGLSTLGQLTSMRSALVIRRGGVGPSCAGEAGDAGSVSVSGV